MEKNIQGMAKFQGTVRLYRHLNRHFCILNLSEIPTG